MNISSCRYNLTSRNPKTYLKVFLLETIVQPIKLQRKIAINYILGKYTRLYYNINLKLVSAAAVVYFTVKPYLILR